MRFNPVLQCAGQVTLALCFVGVFSADAANPVPYIDTLSPTAFAAGTAGAVLTIRGAGFAAGATVHFNGVLLTPSSISASTIAVSIRATDIAAPGTARITVANVNPASASNIAYLPIRTPAASAFTGQTVSSVKAGWEVMGDFNNDGIPDFVATNVDSIPDIAATNAVGVPDITATNGDCHVFLGDGTGRFSQGPAIPSTATCVPLAVGDFNGDGNLDALLLTERATSVMLGDGRGGLILKQLIYTNSRPFVADVTGDGIPDLIGIDRVEFATHGRAAVLTGLGDGTFATTPIVSSSIDAIFAVGDFTGDGILDLVGWTDPHDQMRDMVMRVYQGTGGGQFTTMPNVIGTTYQYRVLTGDFNGDGKLDLLSDKSDGPTILLNDGSGIFTLAPQVFGTIGRSSNYVSDYVAADFDGDGSLDVATSYGIYLNDGKAEFTFASRLPVPVDLVFALHASDFDGDGKVDLLASLSFDVFKQRPAEEHVLLQVPETTAASFPSSVDFGTHGIGIWVNDQVPVTNTGDLPLYVSAATALPDAETGPLDFRVDLNTCAVTVLPGGTCNLHITHRASRLGTGRAALEISGNFQPIPETHLQGKGYPFTNLKNVPVGTTLTFKLPISNLAPNYFLAFIPILIPGAGTPAGDFHIDSGNCDGSLSTIFVTTYRSCEMTLTFRPSRSGFEWATLKLKDAGRGGDPLPYKEIYIYGWGVAPH